jgi:hypothetical protein
MTSKAALFALLALWGVGNCIALPAVGEETPGETRADHEPAKRSFTNRVWVRSDTDDRPGVIRIFLSDGTLVQDSCWETHRLSPWQSTATGVTWNEDGMDIAAEIVSVSARDLVLRVTLGNEAVEERYTAATMPYVCPDMPG